MAVDQNAYPGAKGACEESSDHVHVVIASGFYMQWMLTASVIHIVV